MSVTFGDARLPERFWAKVTVNDRTGCWEWTARLDRKGYGAYGVSRGRMHSAHRVLYRTIVSADIDGLEIDHLCRVRNCVNPAHLEAVTRHENIRRSRVGQPQLARTHCPRGHPYAGTNLYIGHTKTGSNRQCRACKRLWAREHRNGAAA